MQKGTILIVDDNRGVLTSVEYLVEDYFARVLAVSSPESIPSALREENIDVVLLDMNFHAGVNNGNEGLYWLSEIKRRSPHTQVVLFTAYSDVDLAVRGMKAGADDFVIKPWDNARLLSALREAYRKSQAENRQAAAVDDEPRMHWGTSPAVAALRSMTEKVSRTEANILITGENGTGKDMLAREIHRLSPRSGRPFVAVDMGCIPGSLFESELFGHVKGAFTDAHSDRAGRFEAADGGTLFLDEIANLPLHLQAKMLTAIQRRTFTRVGSNEVRTADIRLICATNRRLEQMVAQGEFREDLLYRINTIHLHLPPLRERTDEIMPLAHIFLSEYAERYARRIGHFTQQAEEKLTSHTWPGNIRELQHAIEKAVIMSDSDETIDAADIQITPTATADGAVQDHLPTLEEMERQTLGEALARSHGNLTQAASSLGITRQTLYNKMKRHGL